MKKLIFLETKSGSFSIFFFYLALFILVFPDVVFAGNGFVRADIASFYYPNWQYGVRCMKEGVIPFWNPYNSFGCPFLANVQTCVFYPLTALFYLAPFHWAINFYILLHLTLASFFTFLYLRDEGASLESSLLAGLAFGMSGYLMSTIILTISLCSVAYFPLALLVFRRSLRVESFLWAGTCAVVLLFQYLAGDPAVVLTTFTVYLFIAGFKTLDTFLLTKRVAGRYFFRLVQICLVFFGLSAFHTFIFLEFVANTSRMGLGFEESMKWSMRLHEIVGLFIPFISDFTFYIQDFWVNQAWLENHYAGTLVCLMMLASLSGKREKRVNYYFLLLLLGVLLSLGQFSWIYRLLYVCIPVFKLIRYPQRFFFLTSFSAACLAGYGFEKIMRTKAENSGSLSRAKSYLIVCATVIFSLLSVLALCEPARDRFFLYFVSQLSKADLPVHYDQVLFRAAFGRMVFRSWRSFLVALPLILLYFRIGKLRWTRKVIFLFLMVMVFLDLKITNAVEPRVRSLFWELPFRNIETILKDKGLYRVTPDPIRLSQRNFILFDKNNGSFQKLRDTFTPNCLLPFKIYDSFGYDSIYLKDTWAVKMLMEKTYLLPHRRLFDALNIKYTTTALERMPKNYKKLNQISDANLYRNRNSLPRAYLVAGAQVDSHREKILDRLQSSAFDPENEIFIEEVSWIDDHVEEQKSSAQDEQVKFLEYSPNQVKMKASVGKKKWLFFSDTYYPGWKAWVDGKQVKIYRANYAFRSIRLAEGTHQIVWKYDPWLFKIGLFISALTAAFLCSYYIRYFFRLLKRVHA